MKPGVPRLAVAVSTDGKSTFLVAGCGTAWQVIVHRRGLVEETFPAATRAEACRLARRLSESGLVGFIEENPV